METMGQRRTWVLVYQVLPYQGREGGMMGDWDVLLRKCQEAVENLTPEARTEYDLSMDLMVYGNCMAKLDETGRKVRVPPSEWPGFSDLMEKAGSSVGRNPTLLPQDEREGG